MSSPVPTALTALQNRRLFKLSSMALRRPSVFGRPSTTHNVHFFKKK
jgi:hypothetical protein